MYRLNPNPAQPSDNEASALIESLVAIVIWPWAFWAFWAYKMRTADTQTGVRRAQTVRLIEDLSERSIQP